MPLCQCHPCQMHRIAMIGVRNRNRERIAERARDLGREPEEIALLAIEMWLDAMDAADTIDRTITEEMFDEPGNVVELAQHRRART